MGTSIYYVKIFVKYKNNTSLSFYDRDSGNKISYKDIS